jgi:muconolactone delta-isomerase
MKFLVIGKPREALFTCPLALTRQLTEASLPVMNKQKKEGKLLEIYWIPGAATTVSLYECKTAEEMVKNFNEIPITVFYGFESYQLADFNEAMKIIIERTKEMEKMMPGAPK